ncbi:hypothetical protein ACWEIJ_43435 [Lentzea sp. NPDC004789]
MTRAVAFGDEGLVRTGFRLVLLDNGMPDVDGLTIPHRPQRLRPAPVVALPSGCGEPV